MKKKAPSPLAGLKAKVAVERNGALVSVEDVDAVIAFEVLAEMLAAVRILRQAFPELTAELNPVCGGSIEYSDHEDFDGKRVGFR